MKKKSVFATIAFIICLLVLFVYKKADVPSVIPYINDETVQWDDISYAEVYVGGWAIPPAFTVEDADTIKELVDSLRDVQEYRRIQTGKQLEGLCNVWIEFSNGVCIGTYEDVNQGYIDLELRATGGPFYELPEEFRENILDLVEAHQKVLQY